MIVERWTLTSKHWKNKLNVTVNSKYTIQNMPNWRYCYFIIRSLITVSNENIYFIIYKILQVNKIKKEKKIRKLLIFFIFFIVIIFHFTLICIQLFGFDKNPKPANLNRNFLCEQFYMICNNIR